MHVERTFVVDRTVEDVFDFLSDFENTEQWDPGTVETTRVSGDGGLGTKYRNTSRFMKREVELEYETIGFDRPTSFVCRGRNGGTTATDHLTFTRDGDRTHINYKAVFDFAFPVNVLAPLLVRRPLEKVADETVAQIKRTLEGR